MKAGDLRAGERVVRLDGSTAVVASVRVVPGAADYYNLTVSSLHTFAVGHGRYVVHNCGEHLRKVADREAKEIGGTVVPRGRPQSWANVAVGYARDQDGNIRRLVAMNEKAGPGWFKALQQHVPAGELLTRFETPLLFGMKGFHAEDYILSYVKKNNLDLLGIGSDANICGRCWNRIVKRWGSDVIGTARAS